ncbi:hypothetical protein ACFYW9_12180 [Streptomyces sp. NPDC002698]
MPKSDEYDGTSNRLALWGCLAGLVVALAVPVYLLVTVLFFGMPTP